MAANSSDKRFGSSHTRKVSALRDTMLALGVALPVVVGGGSSWASSPTYEAAMERAKTSAARGNWNEAAEAYTEALSLKPGDAEASARLAKLKRLNNLELLKIDNASPVNSAMFSPDGRRIVAATKDNIAKLWDAETGRAVLTLEGHSGEVNFAAFSSDGKWIVTASEDNTAKLWNAENGRLLLTLEGHPHGVTSAAFSPDGKRTVTAGWDKTAKVWNTARPGPIRLGRGDGGMATRVPGAGAGTGELLLTLEGHSDSVSSAAFSPDGRRIVTASWDKTAKLWDAETGKELLTLKGHSHKVCSAAFSPDGRRIVTASNDKTAKIWDAETGKELLTLSGHSNSVSSAAFSPDGRRIVTASADGTARIWDAETGKELLTLEKAQSYFGAFLFAAFSQDGRRVVTVKKGGTVKVWDVELLW